MARRKLFLAMKILSEIVLYWPWRHNWCQPTMFNGRADTNEQTIKITIENRGKKNIKFWQKSRVHYDFECVCHSHSVLVAHSPFESRKLNFRREGGKFQSPIYRLHGCSMLIQSILIRNWNWDHRRRSNFIGWKWISLETIELITPIKRQIERDAKLYWTNI